MAQAKPQMSGSYKTIFFLMLFFAILSFFAASRLFPLVMVYEA